MAYFTAAQQALMVPEIYALGTAVDPNIEFAGDDNGIDIKAFITTESGIYSQQITAVNIQAQAWATIISQLTSLSTSAGDTPNTVM